MCYPTKQGPLILLPCTGRQEARQASSLAAVQAKLKHGDSLSMASCHACRWGDARGSGIVGSKLRVPHAALAELHGEKVAQSCRSENCHARVAEQNMCDFFKRATANVIVRFYIRLCLPSLNTKRSRIDKKKQIMRAEEFYYI